MALIIKGGEIPVDCLGCDEMVMLSQCPIRLNEPLKYCNGTRHPDCPIIGEIPDKHGRLIDADELEGILDEVNGYGGASEITYKKMIEILHDETLSPTIVEATE